MKIGWRIYCTAITTLTLVILSACSMKMLDNSILEMRKDTIAPALAIDSPAQDSTCANIVEVRGRVTDATSTDGTGRVAALTYSVPNSNVAGTAVPDTDGNFMFQFASDSFEGQFSLIVEALDWNGNKTNKTILLKRDASNSIPGFAAVPGNGTIEVTWSSVPNTDHYILYYTSDGSLPSDTRGTQTTLDAAVSSYSIQNCVNGSLYNLRLKAVPKAGWSESASDYKKTIPLSPMTLCPIVKSDSGLIKVSWRGLPAGGNYEIWRRIGETGEYSLYTETSAIEFTDRNIAVGQSYCYRIKPALYSSILSYANSARPIDFLTRPTITGSVNGLWDANDITVSGNYAFVADRRYEYPSLNIYDISLPYSPRFLKSLPIHARGTVVSGDFAYVISTKCSTWAASESSLYVIDISTPSAAAIVGSVALRDHFVDFSDLTDYKTMAYDLAISGSTVYVAAGRDGLQSFDVSTPSAPAYLECCPMPGTVTNQDKGSAMGVALNGGFAFVGDYLNGIHTIRLSDMSIVATRANVLSDNDWPMKIIIRGNALFAAEGQGGVKIFRIYDDGTGVQALSLFKRVDTVGYAQDLALQDDFLYISDGMSGLQVVDVYDIDAYLTAYELPPASLAAKLAVPMPSDAVSIAVSGSYAYVVLGQSLQVVDLSLASEAKVVKTVEKTTQNATKVEIFGSHAYVATNEGLWVADLSNPANPSMSFAMDGGYPTWFEDIAISGPYLFGLGQGIVNGNFGSGLLVCDLSDPASPSLVAIYGSDLRDVKQVQISGAYGFVACSSGLVVVDLNDPLKPSAITTVPTGKTFGVALSGNYAYVVCSGGLDIVDIADPEKPIILSNLPIQSGTYRLSSISVSGRYAYACDISSGLIIVDIEDPENPVQVKTLKHLTPSSTDSAAYLSFTGFGPWGIVTSYQNKARIVNIADPKKAFLAGNIQEGSPDFSISVYEAAIYDSWAYMTDGRGFRVVQLTP